MAAQKPVVVVFAENVSLVDHDFFSSLGFQTVFFTTALDLANYLRTSRPHALCVVASTQIYLARPQWLVDIERRSNFEGLRVLAFVIIPRGGQTPLQKLLEDPQEQISRVKLSPILSFRDLLVAEMPPFSLSLRKQLSSRVNLALGVATDFSGEEGLSLLVRETRRVHVEVPGRVSWIGRDGAISVECGVRASPGSLCQLRFANDAGANLVCNATVISSTSNNLRFNFGSEVTLRLDSAQVGLLSSFFSEVDGRLVEVGKPILRSVVVVRNAELRERVSELLRSKRVEVRIPLLSRNVRNDIARMNPQIVVIEDSIISAQGGGPGYLSDLHAAVAPETIICVVGPNSTNFVAGLKNVLAMHFSDAEIGLRNLLSRLEIQHVGIDKNRQWFMADSEHAMCVLQFQDRAVFIGNSGITLEGPHTYRSLLNAYVSFGEGLPRMLAKNSSSYVIADTWKLGPSQTAHSRYFFTFLMENKAFGNDFRTTFESVSQLRVAGVAVITPAPPVTVEALLSAVDVSADGSETRLDVVPAAMGKMSAASGQQNSDLVYEALRDEARTRAWRKKKTPQPFGTTADWVKVILILILIAIVIGVVLFFGDSNDTFLNNSFNNLFKKYGK